MNPTDEHREQAREIFRGWTRTGVTFQAFHPNGVHKMRADLERDIVDRIASALASRDAEMDKVRADGYNDGFRHGQQSVARDAEVREVLEGTSRVLKFKNGPDQRCWCNKNWSHTPACLAARALYEKLQPENPDQALRDARGRGVGISTTRPKKQKIAEQLRDSDLTAQSVGRTDIEYGPHDSLPRGEHVSRLGKHRD